MRRFDRAILAAVVALGVVVGALSVASARLGPTVDTLTTAQTLDGVAVNTQIGVSFSEAMNQRTVERQFRIHPSVRGDFSWSGNQLLFIPRHNLAYSTRYTVTIDRAALDRVGKAMYRSFHRSFTTQAPHLLYLGTQGSERNRLVLKSINGKSQIVGSDDGLVQDFSVSSDRSLAVYTKRGSANERPDEIWLLSLTDDSTQRIVRQPSWTISQPHISPDGHYVVFLATNVVLCRPYYGCYRDNSGPVVYLYDLHARHLFPFRSASDVPITNFIDFSPAGQIAYTDLGSALTLANPDGTHVVHIPNSGNSLVYAGFDAAGDKAAFVGQTPDSSGGDVLIYSGSKYIDVSHGLYDASTPAIASSGRVVAYAAYRGERGIEPVYGINVYAFKTHRTRRLTAQRDWSDWSPAWSLDDRYLAFVRSSPTESMYMGSGEVWVMRSDGSDARPIGGPGEDVVWVS